MSDRLSQYHFENADKWWHSSKREALENALALLRQVPADAVPECMEQLAREHDIDVGVLNLLFACWENIRPIFDNTSRKNASFTNAEYATFNQIFIKEFLPTALRQIKSDKAVDGSVKFLGRINAGESLDLDDAAKATGMSAWLILLAVEIRNLDRRVALAEQKVEREAFETTQEWLEKIGATKQ